MKKIALLVLSLGLAAFNAFADVNINTATQAQLETLQGIGPVKAKAIIDYRSKNGAFKSLADLEKVQGIGPGLFKQIKSDVKLSGETVVKAHDKGEHKGAAKKTTAKAEPAKPAVKAEPAKPATPSTKADVKTETKVDTKATDKGAKK